MDNVTAKARTRAVQIDVTKAAIAKDPFGDGIQLSTNEHLLYQCHLNGFELRKGFRKSTTNFYGIRNPLFRQAMGYLGQANRSSGPAPDEFVSIGEGRFAITDSRLLFFGVQGSSDIALSDIELVQLMNGLIVKPNGMLIHLKDSDKPLKFGGADAMAVFDAATALQTAIYLLEVDPQKLLQTLQANP